MTFADRAKQIPAALPFGAHVGHENFSGFGLRAHVQERAAPLIRALKQSRFPGPTCGGLPPCKRTAAPNCFASRGI